ncbi:hypothetical protein QCE47_28045 [Caballeronia sp. LZ025]|uniref:hypothetical protein n=1 Tax=Caballeronia TaxID=1827195 RepID=UPI001FD407D7|nr:MULTISPECIES: hypothetical protein [Caballeronia]MDR5736169.1 hypothetical protein [Caballeronia sp. LZ025]
MFSFRKLGLVAGGFFAGMLATAFVRFLPSQSSDWASWAQAIGAVAAIIGSFVIARRQSEFDRSQAFEAERRQRLREVEAFTAVAEHGVAQGTALADAFRNMPAFALAQALSLNLFNIDEASTALFNVPLHQVGSRDAVIQFSGIQSTIKEMSKKLESYRRLDDQAAQLHQLIFAAELDSARQRAEFHLSQFKLHASSLA